MMTALFVWLRTNGRLHAQIWHGPPYVGAAGKTPVARHPLSEAETKLPLAALERIYPPPVIHDQAAG